MTEARRHLLPTPPHLRATRLLLLYLSWLVLAPQYCVYNSLCLTFLLRFLLVLLVLVNVLDSIIFRHFSNKKIKLQFIIYSWLVFVGLPFSSNFHVRACTGLSNRMTLCDHLFYHFLCFINFLLLTSCFVCALRNVYSVSCH